MHRNAILHIVAEGERMFVFNTNTRMRKFKSENPYFGKCEEKKNDFLSTKQSEG